MKSTLTNLQKARMKSVDSSGVEPFGFKQTQDDECSSGEKPFTFKPIELLTI